MEDAETKSFRSFTTIELLNDIELNTMSDFEGLLLSIRNFKILKIVILTESTAII